MPSSHGDFSSRRNHMVATQIERRGVSDPRVLTAMRRVPRELFVGQKQEASAYADSALPITEGQTISQPYIVAAMAEAARISADDKVLEIGTGSGYAAAILAELGGEIFSIERHAALADLASSRLAADWSNVHVIHGDGTKGLAAEAPFDAILVTARAPVVPAALKEQLRVGGRLVIPVGDERVQSLCVITRTAESKYETRDLVGVQFVPLISDSD